MTIDKDSRGAVIGVIATCTTLVILCLAFIPWYWVSLSISAVIIWFAIFVTCFFRIPKRKHQGGEKTVTSVADGEVVVIEKVFEPEYLKREAIQVSIYMNFFDMHANFWPIDGEVTYYKYHPGKHLFAFKPKASEENEHTCTNIRTADGQDVYFKQLAGTFARRIVNYSEKTNVANGGKQCGIIKFGSRIDMYFPLDAEIKVHLGQVTRAVETVIAELR